MKTLTLSAIFASLILSTSAFAQTETGLNQDDDETSPPPRHRPRGPMGAGVTFVDVNGDQIADLVKWRFRGAGSKTFLGNGDGSFAEEGIKHRLKKLPKRVKARQMVHFADVTNDGRADKIVRTMIFKKRPPRQEPPNQDQIENGGPDRRPPKVITFMHVFKGNPDGSFDKHPIGAPMDDME